MLGKKNRGAAPAVKDRDIDTLIGRDTEIRGDVIIKGGLHIDGSVRGNVSAEHGSGAALNISENGMVEGEVHVPFVTLNGRITGDLHASSRVDLQANAIVDGDVHYGVMTMEMGAEVNGRLVRMNEDKASAKVSAGQPAAAKAGADAAKKTVTKENKQPALPASS